MLVLLSALAGALAAADVSYFRDVRPILAERCESCHRGAAPIGNFAVANAPAAADRLLSVVTGNPPRMPKTGTPLTPAQVNLLRQWIEQGAHDDTPADTRNETWWSLRPLEKPSLNSIDGFVKARLAKNSLTPSLEADRRTLIRRLSYDLHGLPPSPAEIDAFFNDASPGAYTKLVDRMLASPRYGERWARHWLDVVHYGDSHGYDKDKPRPNAWPYRDYVIRSFNEDKPYARFVAEQLAGDVLYPDDPQGIIATGFIAAGPWDFVGHQELREGTTDKNLTRVLDRDDMVAATMSTFTSMTAHCARCHDHKFDPIKQEDYYSLQTVFAGVDRADRPYDSDRALLRQRRELTGKARDLQRQLQPLLDKVEFATSEEIVALDDRIKDAKSLAVHLGDPKTPAEAEEKKRLLDRAAADQTRKQALIDAIVGAETYRTIEQLKARIKGVQAQIAAMPKPQQVYAATNFFERAGTFRPALDPRPVHLLIRGSVQAEGKLMTAGTISSITNLPARFPQATEEGARRVALAQWITHRDNPLTWRSIVNRVWHYHFGNGLVDTPNDFGRMGSRPSHPELLDWLALWFRDDAQGSLKKLHRLIVTSATYRQASALRPEAAKLDADNRLLWRMNRVKLDAESVRDSVLAAAGKLDLKMGGPGAQMFWFKNDHSPIYDYARFDPDGEGGHRRSIYRFIVRSVPDPFLERLDCPDPSLLAPKRSITLTAIQALALWNNPFMLRMSEHLAARLRSESPDAAAQIRLAARLLDGHEPAEHVQTELLAYSAKHGLENLCRLLFNTNEFLFVD